MKLAVATDHAGLEFKNSLVKILQEDGHDVLDCGPESFDADDDYPDFIGKAAEVVSKNEDYMGIVMGGSGQGEQITANKYKNVRCALFYGPVAPIGVVDVSGKTSSDPFEIIKLTRQHNNSNMLSLGIRFLDPDDAIKAVRLFISSPFPQEERHVRRIEKIKEIENAR